MTDLLPAPWSYVLFAAAILLVGGAIWWIRSRRLVPRGWTHVGEKRPLGTSAALEILRELCPGMPWGGTVEWVLGPWPAGYEGERVVGQVLDMARHRIRVEWMPTVEDTALAHEIDHLRRKSATETDESRAWVARANAAIRARLGG